MPSRWFVDVAADGHGHGEEAAATGILKFAASAASEPAASFVGFGAHAASAAFVAAAAFAAAHAGAAGSASCEGGVVDEVGFGECAAAVMC